MVSNDNFNNNFSDNVLSYSGVLIPALKTFDFQNNILFADVLVLTDRINLILKSNRSGFQVTKEYVAQEIYSNNLEGFSFSKSCCGIYKSKLIKDDFKPSFFKRLFTPAMRGDYFIHVFRVEQYTGFYR